MGGGRQTFSTLDSEPNIRSRTDDKKMRKPPTMKYVLLGLFIGLLIGTAVTLGVYFGLPPRGSSSSTVDDGGNTDPSFAKSAIFTSAAVAADAGICSTMGKDILEKGGSVVDAGITTTLCVGVVNSHSCGIGGGHFTVFYNVSTDDAIFLNARETAPLAANETMFVNSTKSSTRGGHAVGVPGEIAGCWRAHQLYGKLTWREVIDPITAMCENGFEVTEANSKAIKSSEESIRNKTFNLWPVFLNDDDTLKQTGDIIRRPQLAATFRKVAEEGGDVFYNGSLARDIVLDLQEAYLGSSITEEDLNIYEPELENALESQVGDYTVYSAGLPGSGAVLCLILNILDGYNLTESDLNESNKGLTYHRISESFRFAYAKRSALGDDRNNLTITELAKNMTSDWFADEIRSRINDSTTYPVDYYDPEFDIPESYGTSHLSIIDEEGNAVAITSTINTYFGSKVRGTRTGIIFNNEMDDFSTPGVSNSYGVPPSPSNYIRPGNRPQSSMSPTIIVGNKDGKRRVEMVAGASGGTRITTGTALTIMNSIWFGKSAEESVEMKRIHDQLMPDRVDYDVGFDESVVEDLKSRGHNVKSSTSNSVVQAIKRTSDDKLDAACDSRKGGYPDGY